VEDKLVTILTFDNPVEANIIKTLLENNDIYCFLADESLLDINPLYSNALGRIKLQVKEGETDTAKRVLEESDYDFKFHRQGDNIHVQPCTKCNSRKVYPERAGLLRILLSIPLLCIPIIFRKRKWRCYNCNYSWIEPITANKIFFSIAIIPFLLYIWAQIYREILIFFQ